jgi:putative transposase
MCGGADDPDHFSAARRWSPRSWLVSLMNYDLGFFDDRTCQLEPAPNPFGAKVLPMSPE